MASVTTRDHEEVREWAHAHHATPAIVSRTGGMLRFEFSSASARGLAPVGWDEFFSIFDEKGLDLVYDDAPDSRFHKFAYPETAAAASRPRAPRQSSPKPAARRSAAAKAKSPASKHHATAPRHRKAA